MGYLNRDKIREYSGVSDPALYGGVLTDSVEEGESEAVDDEDEIWQLSDTQKWGISF